VADVFRHFGPASVIRMARRCPPCGGAPCCDRELPHRRSWRSRRGVRDCGHQRVSYNSCRNKSCPKCQARARPMARGPSGRTARRAYFHIVFTVPQQIEVIAFQNQTVVYDILFRAASETLRKIAPIQSIWARRSASWVCCNLGAVHLTPSTCSFSVPGGGSRRMERAGSPAGQDTFFRSRVLSQMFRVVPAHLGRRFAAGS